MPFGSEYPICSQIDRPPNVGPRFDKAALACQSHDSLASSAGRLLYTTSLEKQAPSSAKQSRDDGLAGVSLELTDIGVPSKPAWAGPGQARSSQVAPTSRGQTGNPQCGMRPQPQPQPQPLPQPSRAIQPCRPDRALRKEKKTRADEVVLREGGHAGVGHVLSGFGRMCFTAAGSLRLTYSSRRARFWLDQQAGRPQASHAFPTQPNPPLA